MTLTRSDRTSGATILRLAASSSAVVALAGLLIVALTACGNPTQKYGAAASPTSQEAQATPLAAANSGSSAVPPGAAPTQTPCQVISNSGGGALNPTHGAPNACFTNLYGAFIIGIPGSVTGDARPGYLACTPPGGNEVESFCVEGPVSRWQFFPFPATDAKEVGLAVSPQQYTCVGNASQIWTFHLDTLTYTSGCHVVDMYNLPSQPCSVLLYTGSETVDPLYLQYGKVVTCGSAGGAIVGVMAGNPQPGVVVCSPPASTNPEDAYTFCGLRSLEPAQRPLAAAHWAFTPLPVAAGPVDSATFDTAAGTACITVGAQSFTFTVSASAVTPGCAGAPPVATATP